MIRRPDPEQPPGSGLPWSRDPEAEDPEPGWAREIRERRKARGDRLRRIFDTFDSSDTPDDEKVSDT